MGVAKAARVDMTSRLDEIHERLEQFRLIPEDQWFYELCYCLLTPQTKARNAEHAVQQLHMAHFKENGDDPTEILRAPSHYVRFHITKSKRLLGIRQQWHEVVRLLHDNEFSVHRNEAHRMRSLRDILAESIDGIGMKEASHFLRNIGARGLAILDRHLLNHLVKRGVYNSIPRVGIKREYRQVEEAFADYAEITGIPIDVLDLLFWSENTGYIGK